MLFVLSLRVGGVTVFRYSTIIAYLLKLLDLPAHTVRLTWLACLNNLSLLFGLPDFPDWSNCPLPPCTGCFQRSFLRSLDKSIGK